MCSVALSIIVSDRSVPHYKMVPGAEQQLDWNHELVLHQKGTNKKELLLDGGLA